MTALDRIEVCLVYKSVNKFLTIRPVYVIIPDMPIIRSAIKKVRKDKTRTARNKKRELNLKSLIKKARLTKSAKDLQAVYSALDKAVKVKLIHRNKASRLKSRLSKGVTGTAPTTKTVAKKLPAKKVVNKTPKK